MTTKVLYVARANIRSNKVGGDVRKFTVCVVGPDGNTYYGFRADWDGPSSMIDGDEFPDLLPPNSPYTIWCQTTAELTIDGKPYREAPQHDATGSKRAHATRPDSRPEQPRSTAKAGRVPRRRA